jgi:hypothetical protein
MFSAVNIFQFLVIKPWIWIRNRIRIGIDIKCWIRIRIETNADLKKHCLNIMVINRYCNRVL